MIEALEQELARARDEFEKERRSVSSAADLAQLKSRFTGKKAGALTSLFRQLGSVPAESRPRAGALLNELKAGIESAIAALETDIASREREARLEKEAVDVTLPGRRARNGSLHPVTSTRLLIERIFRDMGYAVATGPEIEDDFHNFEALNLPADHPARDAHDTFYLDSGLL